MIPDLNATLIIIGHGSTTNEDSSEPTHLHADEIRKIREEYEKRIKDDSNRH
jgi:hypothetical protein